MTPEDAAHRLRLIQDYPKELLIVPHGEAKREARRVKRSNERYASWLERIAHGGKPCGPKPERG